MMRQGRRASPLQRKLVRERQLKIKHDWKMLVIIFIIAVIGCLLGAYLGLNYSD